MSLYPSVTACTEEGEQYPVGYPTIKLGPELGEFLRASGGLEKVFGFAHCEILAPSRLRIPSVPVRSNGKLLFALCRSCAEAESTTPCTHAAKDRSFTVHISTPEENLISCMRQFNAFHYIFSSMRPRSRAMRWSR